MKSSLPPYHRFLMYSPFMRLSTQVYLHCVQEYCTTISWYNNNYFINMLSVHALFNQHWSEFSASDTCFYPLLNVSTYVLICADYNTPFQTEDSWMKSLQKENFIQYHRTPICLMYRENVFPHQNSYTQTRHVNNDRRSV